MNRNFLFIVNPISGTRTKGGLESFIKTVCEEKKYVHTIIHTEPQMDMDSLSDYILKSKFTDVIICGGDGTVNMVINGLRHLGINFGIIPVGSGNGLSRGAGIPMKPREAFQIIEKGNVQLTDAFFVNNHFSCMLSGIGLDAAVAQRFANGTKRGLYNYTKQTLIQFFKAHPYQFEIELEGFRFFSDAFFISVANSNQFGNNMTIAPLASLTDGLLDIVIVQKMPKAGMPLAILKQVRGNNKLFNLAEDVGKKNIIYLQTASLKIINHQLAPFHIDGDPVETESELNIKILPKAFKMLVP
ncbi:diacylglycerol/lipid kinase family protein [Polluticaenibacter yanchengensis]|uniref:Diacylglycerol kinase family lipid kinase n=1 Tax=Polluticaenibacter yanchengensis TaxID=3014562 RepID=A0ABT4UH35_9BACT|nr:diacylglycerol kinase family lipid kinase [Chitinophagaceae bacterium LY-5]